MPRFSVYLIHDTGDTETFPIIVDVETEAEALISATAYARDWAGAEVWHLSRMVCRVPGGDWKQNQLRPSSQHLANSQQVAPLDAPNHGD
jgi:hypothetical protein